MRMLSFVAACGVFFSAVAAHASTVTLIDVTSSFGSGIGGVSLGPNGAPVGQTPTFGAAQGFTANADIVDAAISIPFLLCGTVCEGRAQLVELTPNTSTPDPTDTVNNVLMDRRFCGTARFGCDLAGFDPVLSGFSLTSGLDYFLALSVVVGGGQWIGAATASDVQSTGTGDITVGSAFAIPAADVSTEFLLSNTLQSEAPETFLFKITGTVVQDPVDPTPPAVPLPAGAVLLFTAIGTLALHRRT